MDWKGGPEDSEVTREAAGGKHPSKGIYRRESSVYKSPKVGRSLVLQEAGRPVHSG